jgi:hypothetical protein
VVGRGQPARVVGHSEDREAEVEQDGEERLAGQLGAAALAAVATSAGHRVRLTANVAHPPPGSRGHPALLDSMACPDLDGRCSAWPGPTAAARKPPRPGEHAATSSQAVDQRLASTPDAGQVVEAFDFWTKCPEVRQA